MQVATQTWNLAGPFYGDTLPPVTIPCFAPSSARRIFASSKQVLVGGRADFLGSDLPKVRLSIQNARYDWSRQLNHFAADMVMVQPDARLATELKTSPEWRCFSMKERYLQAKLSRMQELDPSNRSALPVIGRAW
jgi:hypothetical protein